MGQLFRLPILLALSMASSVATGQPSSENHSTPELITAVQRVSYDEVNQLLESGVNVNVSRADGSTALSWASQRPDIHIVTALLKAGADPNSQDENGETPLTLASARGNLQVVEALINSGADITANRWSGETPLHAAVFGGNLDVVRLLIERGVDVNAKDSRMGQTPLMRSVAGGKKEITLALLASGASLSSISIGGFQAIHFAALYGQEEIAEILIDANAQGPIAASELGSPFLIALSEGYEVVARLLLTDEIDVNVRDSEGTTPLHEAAGAGMLSLTKDLIERGADIDARLGELPGNVYEPGRSGGTTPFLAAARGGHVDVMKFLLSMGANPHDKSDDGAGSVMFATRSLDIEAVRLLVELGADVNAVPENRPSAIHTAIRFGKNEIIDYLASSDADLEIRDHNNRTPLEEAEFEAPISTIELVRGLVAKRDNRP